MSFKEISTLPGLVLSRGTAKLTGSGWSARNLLLKPQFQRERGTTTKQHAGILFLKEDFPCRKTGKAQIQPRLEDPHLWPRWGVRISFELGVGHFPSSFFSLPQGQRPPRQLPTNHWSFKAPKRGKKKQEKGEGGGRERIFGVLVIKSSRWHGLICLKRFWAVYTWQLDILSCLPCLNSGQWHNREISESAFGRQNWPLFSPRHKER